MKTTFIYLFTSMFTISLCQDYSYHEIINSAEINIVDNKLDDAINDYKTAFNKNNGLMFTDLTNLMKCYCVQDKNIPTKFIIELSKYKIEKKAFKTNKILKKCLKKNNVNIKTITNLNIKNYDGYDEKYVKELNEIYRFDQDIRKKKHAYSKYKKEIFEADSVNILNFIELVGEKGFPCERTIGITSIDGSPVWYIVVRHFYQHLSLNKLNEFEFRMNQILENAVRKNQITPRLYAHLLELKGNNLFNENWILYINNKNDFRIKDTILNNLKEVNNNRDSIGLNKIQEYLKILNYKRHNNIFIFKHYEPYFYVPKDLEFFYKNNTIELDNFLKKL